MPTMTVNNASIEYEVFGDGPLLVWTEGGRFGRNELSYLIAGHFSHKYSVLIWDRRNAFGASEVVLSDAANYIVTDSEDLHALLQNLNLGPACFAGASAGSSLSLWMGHRYPEDIRSLILFSAPTDNNKAFAPGVTKHCFSLADIAARDGMRATLDASIESWLQELQGEPVEIGTWLAQTAYRNPANREKIIALDPHVFAQTTRRWGEFLLSMSWPAGLSKDDLRAIPFPALIIPGDDEIHPRDSAEKLLGLLEQAKMVEYPDTITAETSVIDRFYSMFPAIDDFLLQTLKK